MKDLTAQAAASSSAGSSSDNDRSIRSRRGTMTNDVQVHVIPDRYIIDYDAIATRMMLPSSSGTFMCSLSLSLSALI
jgi:hypothetical protein